MCRRRLPTMQWKLWRGSSLLSGTPFKCGSCHLRGIATTRPSCESGFHPVSGRFVTGTERLTELHLHRYASSTPSLTCKAQAAGWRRLWRHCDCRRWLRYKSSRRQGRACRKEDRSSDGGVNDSSCPRVAQVGGPPASFQGSCSPVSAGQT